MLSARAHVPDRGYQVVGDLPLYVEAILVGIGGFEIVKDGILQRETRCELCHSEGVRKGHLLGAGRVDVGGALQGHREPPLFAVGRGISVEQIQKLVQENLIVVHSESAANRGLAIPPGIPGKAKSGREIEMVSRVRLCGLQLRTQGISQKPHLSIHLGGYGGDFIAQAKIQRQPTRDVVVVLEVGAEQDCPDASIGFTAWKRHGDRLRATKKEVLQRIKRVIASYAV